MARREYAERKRKIPTSLFDDCKIRHSNMTQSTLCNISYFRGILTRSGFAGLFVLWCHPVYLTTCHIMERIEIREKKTGKVKNFPISDTAAKVLREYLHSVPSNAPLFPSRKGSGPITRQQAYRILNEAAHLDKKGYSLDRLQKIFNHSSSRITLAYIGMTQDDTDEIYLNLNL